MCSILSLPEFLCSFFANHNLVASKSLVTFFDHSSRSEVSRIVSGAKAEVVSGSFLKVASVFAFHDSLPAGWVFFVGLGPPKRISVFVLVSL